MRHAGGCREKRRTLAGSFPLGKRRAIRHEGINQCYTYSQQQQQQKQAAPAAATPCVRLSCIRRQQHCHRTHTTPSMACTRGDTGNRVTLPATSLSAWRGGLVDRVEGGQNGPAGSRRVRWGKMTFSYDYRTGRCERERSIDLLIDSVINTREHREAKFYEEVTKKIVLGA